MAAKYSEETGALMLNQTIRGKLAGAVEVLFGEKSAITKKAWDLASGSFARGASGEARAFLHEPLGRVYPNVERPILMRSDKAWLNEIRF